MREGVEGRMRERRKIGACDCSRGGQVGRKRKPAAMHRQPKNPYSKESKTSYSSSFLRLKMTQKLSAPSPAP